MKLLKKTWLIPRKTLRGSSSAWSKNMHELPLDDEKLELALSHRPLRGVALRLFTTKVTGTIPNSSSKAKDV